MNKIAYIALILIIFRTPAIAGNFLNEKDPSFYEGLVSPGNTLSHEIDDVDKQVISHIAQHRTKNDCDQALAEAQLSLTSFFGPPLMSEEELKPFQYLYKDVFSDHETIIFSLKKMQPRKRPFQEKLIQPCEGGDLVVSGGSFPSGHSAHAYLTALILSELYPDRKEALLKRAEELGNQRVVLGVHYPSDVQAGVTLAKRVFKKLHSSNYFEKDLSEVRKKISQNVKSTGTGPLVEGQAKPEMEGSSPFKEVVKEVQSAREKIKTLSKTVPLTQIRVKPIDLEEFHEIKELSEYLLKICPPATCVLVGAGRSPTPVMAYIQGLALGKSSVKTDKPYAYNFPLSNFRYGVGNRDPLSSKMETKLYQHFDQYLPTSEQLQGKSVLLFDYGVTGGHSALAAQHYLQTYYDTQSKNSHLNSPTVKSAILVETKKPLDQVDLRMDVLDGLSYQFNNIIGKKSNSKLITALHGEDYDPFSEFGSYYIDQTDNDNRKNPKYEILVSQLKSLNEMGPQHDASPSAFVAIEQDGKLESLSDVKESGKTPLYLRRLYRYPGSDRQSRYEEALRDPELKVELFKNVANVQDEQIRVQILKQICQEENLEGLFVIRLSTTFLMDSGCAPLVEKKTFNPDLLTLALTKARRNQYLEYLDNRLKEFHKKERKKYSDPKLSKILVMALKDSDKASSDNSRKILEKALSDDFREILEKTLSEISLKNEETLDVLVALLKDPNQDTRSSAARVIKSLFRSTSHQDEVDQCLGGAASGNSVLSSEQMDRISQLMDTLKNE